jgi:hypothetical protein
MSSKRDDAPPAAASCGTGKGFLNEAEGALAPGFQGCSAALDEPAASRPARGLATVSALVWRLLLPSPNCCCRCCKGRKLLICDDNALVGLPTKGGTDSQRNRADRVIGHGATHCNISVMIMQQMMTNVPPSIRRLAGVFILFPHRIAHESIPLIAKSCMIPKKYMYQMFEWTKQTGPYGFLLIENDPVPGRARCRINGERAVLGIT